MGVQISSIIPSKEIELTDLAGKKIAVDALNTLFQFLAIIRDRMTGEPLKDSKGRITSHLSGLFYRTSNLIEAGIKPVFVFDGKPPEFKRETLEAREVAKKEAERKWEEAVERGEAAIKYAQAASRMTDDMLEGSKKLLDYMGIPHVQAPSEGEMQCAFMCKKGEVWASASQDYDSVLDGSPRLVRNLSISGRKKLPGKEVYVEVKPELIELDKVLSELGITHEQLVVLGILVGTDYNPNGVKGIGPKTALKLVKEHKTLKKVMENVEWTFDVKAEDIYEFFLNPPAVEDYKLEWKAPDKKKLMDFMVDEHDFSAERMEKVIDKLQENYNKSKQSSLSGWVRK
ncbi:MAG: flap endonuclease-1 [Candidatus Aenigmarchaeota archaeon]|nr:flap endonuclease-1 [Candidatus Aenigmarchaeota archaeon]